MKKISCIFYFIFLFSCQSKPDETDFKHINGYWEIDFVSFEDGTKKEYPVNEFVDYYQMNQRDGIKQKGKPQLDGTILMIPSKDKIKLVDSIDQYFMKIESSFSKFSDRIISIDEDEMVMENESKIQYHYKRFHLEK